MVQVNPQLLIITVPGSGGGGGGPTSTIKNLQVYDSTWNAVVLSWDPTDSSYHYYDTEYSPDGSTWYRSLTGSGATVDFISGLTPGQPGFWFRVRAWTSGVAEPWQQTASAYSLTARTPAYKIEADNKVIANSLSAGSTICNLWTNLPGPVTWSVVGLGNIGGSTGFFNDVQNGWKALQTNVTSTGANTARLTVASTIDPSILGYAPLEIVVSNGTTSYKEKIWIAVTAATQTVSVATSISLSATYHPGQTTTFVIPPGLPLGSVVATLTAHGGYFTSSPSSLWNVSWWTENSTSSTAAGILEIEGKAVNQCRLILLNTPPPGTYSVTVGLGATQTTDGHASSGQVTPLRQTVNFVVLPAALNGTIGVALNHIDNADIIGTQVGQLSVTGLGSTVSFQIMPDFHDRGVQYSLTQSGALSVGQILSAGTDVLFAVVYDGLTPATASQCLWSLIRIPVAWATPTASDSEMVNGQIHIGPTRKYKTRSAFMNTALAQWAPGAHEFYPEPSKNTYAGVELVFDNGPYQNDCTVLDVNGNNVYPDVFEGYLTFPMKLTGDTSVPSSWVRFYADPEPDIGNSEPGNFRQTNSKSYFDIQSYDLILRHCAIDSFAQGESEYKAINFEAIQAPAKVIIDNCSIGWSDMGILNGEAGKRLIISNSVLAMCGTGDGQTHNFYSGPNDLIIADNILTFGTQRGHNFKTRSYAGVYKALRSLDGNVGSASYCIDMPNNGAHWIIPGRRQTILHKGPNSENTILIHYGGEINEGHWFNQLVIDGSFGSFIAINDWSQIGNLVGPVYGIVDASNCVQGPVANITIKNLHFVNINSSNYTLQTGAGGQANLSSANLAAASRPTNVDFSLPFTNGMTVLPIQDRNTYVWNVMVGNTPAIQQGVYLASDILAENMLSLPHTAAAGTTVCTPSIRAKSATDPQTWMTGSSGYPVGTTVITMWTHPPIGAALSPAPGAQFPAKGLAAGTKVTGIDTSYNVTISPPTTGQIYFGDIVSYSGPLTMNGTPTLSVTDDSGGVLAAVGGRIIYNGGLTGPKLVTGLLTATPASPVQMQTGSGLAPLPVTAGQVRFCVMFS